MTDVQRRLSAILSADVVGYARLVGADEAGAIAALQRLRREIVEPKLAEHQGRLVKLMGDGMLAEFPSVVEAVQFACEAQTALVQDTAATAPERRLHFRMGINLGDVIIDGDDIQGDGVNIAARLETMCAPGGVCISDLVHQAIDGKVEQPFEDLGHRELKNIASTVRVWQWHLDDAAARQSSANSEPQIQFCTAPDGSTIAYATTGRGPALVKAPNWMNHLEYDWISPVWRHMLTGLSRNRTLVRFDQRGNGLSDRHPPEITFENMVTDMAAVVDAAGLERFDLLGVSQGCLYAIAYAARFPERVKRLVLYGGSPFGAHASGIDYYIKEQELWKQMILLGWGNDNPSFRQFFTTRFMPGGSKQQMDWFNDLQRETATAETAAHLTEMVSYADVRDMMPKLNLPTLVLHCRGDGIVPFEAGRLMAAGIPGARFVPLEGQNHLMLEDEPAWPRFLSEVNQFLAEGIDDE